MSKKSETRLVAKRYAKALHGLAGKDAPSLMEAAKALGLACLQDDVRTFLSNPLLNREQSAAVVEAVFDKVGAPKLLKDTAIRMAHNRRLAVLPEMLEQFALLVEAEQNIVRVKVVSAKALGDKEIKILADKIAAEYGFTPSVETEIKPELIGGVQLLMGDKLIDYSVAGKLERLAADLKHIPIAKKG